MIQASTIQAIPGHAGYFAGSDGRIYTAKKRANSLTELVATTGRDGYYAVCLYENASRVRKRVHALIALTFHGPKPREGMLVRHLDGDKHNNRPTNLRWGTVAENSADYKRHMAERACLREVAAC